MVEQFSNGPDANLAASHTGGGALLLDLSTPIAGVSCRQPSPLPPGVTCAVLDVLPPSTAAGDLPDFAITGRDFSRWGGC